MPWKWPRCSTCWVEPCAGRPRSAKRKSRAIAERAVAIREGAGPRRSGPGGEPRQSWRPADAGGRSRRRKAAARARAGDSGRAFGPDHLPVAAALQSLAGVLMTLTMTPGRRCCSSGRSGFGKRAYGTDHPETIRTLVNLAISYQETGDYTGRENVMSARSRSPKRSPGPPTAHPPCLDRPGGRAERPGR